MKGSGVMMVVALMGWVPVYLNCSFTKMLLSLTTLTNVRLNDCGITLFVRRAVLLSIRSNWAGLSLLSGRSLVDNLFILASATLFYFSSEPASFAYMCLFVSNFVHLFIVQPYHTLHFLFQPIDGEHETGWYPFHILGWELYGTEVRRLHGNLHGRGIL